MLTIKSINTPRKNSNTRRVYFFETEEFELIPQQVIRFHDIKEGMTFEDLDEYRALVAVNQYELAKNRGLRILSRSEKTTKEIETKLKEDGYFDKVISEVISFLVDYKLCDDRELASRYIEHHLSCGIPFQKIKFKLLYRGIPKELCEELYNDLHSEEFEQIQEEKGRSLIEKFDLSQRKDCDKALRKLVTKGYSFTDAKKIINSLQDRG